MLSISDRYYPRCTTRLREENGWSNVALNKFPGNKSNRRCRTLKSHDESFAPGQFDLIVVEEFQHAAAASYRPVINYFSLRDRFVP